MAADAAHRAGERLWRSVRRRLRPGMVIDDEARYVIAHVDRHRFVVQRTKTASLETVTRSRVLWTWAQLLRGRPLARQANRPHGISFTVAVATAVAAALGRRVTFDREGDCFVAS